MILTVANVSLNLTGQKWDQNLDLIYKAIDEAVKSKVDILSFSELTLTTSSCADYYKFSDNTLIHQLLQYIAEYAYIKKPELVLSIGHPWRYADKFIEVLEGDARQSRSKYNRLNNPFIVQTLIQKGTIIAMSAKSHFDDELYESRHFIPWDNRDEDVLITLPELTYFSKEGSQARVIPTQNILFGNPLVTVQIGGENISIVHAIGDNVLAIRTCKSHHTTTILLNPSATMPVNIQTETARMAAKLHALSDYTLFIKTNPVGNQGGDCAFSGEQIVAYKKSVDEPLMIAAHIHAGFNDINITVSSFEIDKTCYTASCQDVQMAHGSTNMIELLSQKKANDTTGFQLELANDSLWLFDYLRKYKLKTIVQSYSGGFGSTYNAAKIRLMVELASESLGGVALFVRALGYAPGMIEGVSDKGLQIDAVMKQLLTCVYCFDNDTPLEAQEGARAMAEKLGATFLSRDIQGLLEKLALFHTDVDYDLLTQAQQEFLLSGIQYFLSRAPDASEEVIEQERVRFITDAQAIGISIKGHLLSKADARDHAVIAKLKDRCYALMSLTVGNFTPASVGITNTTLDKLCLDQIVFGGNLHGGQLGIAEKTWRADQYEHLDLLNRQGQFKGAFTELLAKASKTYLGDKQTRQLFNYMLHEKHESGRKLNPTEVYLRSIAHPLFNDESIESVYELIKHHYQCFAKSQLNIHAAPLSSNYDGKAVNHDLALRTPNLNGFHEYELAKLALYCLNLLYPEEHWEQYNDYVLFNKSLLKQVLKHQSLGALRHWVKDAPEFQYMLVDTAVLHRAREYLQGAQDSDKRVDLAPKCSDGSLDLIKIATASCNQTSNDWARNVTNICLAIDHAIEDGADLLCLQELGLSGYCCDDYFEYTDNHLIHHLLETIASYAASKNPNLIISLGHPWRLSLEDNPLASPNHKPFNVQTLITHGDIVSMSAKSYLFNYERGYEGRYFQEWNNSDANLRGGRDGVIEITLPELTQFVAEGTVTKPSRRIPFGSPVIQVMHNHKPITLFHVVCEESWIGSEFDNGNSALFDQDNPLAIKNRQCPISIAINPNASPSSAKKLQKHRVLATEGARHCGYFVHVNFLGTESSAIVGLGTQLIAHKGEIVSEAAPLSALDVSYSSHVVEAPFIDMTHLSYVPHVTLEHQSHDKAHLPGVNNKSAPWITDLTKIIQDKLVGLGLSEEDIQTKVDERIELEIEIRAELLWIFDMMRKLGIQGFVQALSGGADSAYNATKIRLMAQFVIKERGLSSFLDALHYPLILKENLLARMTPLLKSKSHDINLYDKDVQQAIDLLMESMLHNYYLSTPNNSSKTRQAALTLVAGGTFKDETGHDRSFNGIAGLFHDYNIQPVVDELLFAFTGIHALKNREIQAMMLKKMRFYAGFRRDDIQKIYNDLLKEQADFIKSIWPQGTERLSHEEKVKAKALEEARLIFALEKHFKLEVALILEHALQRGEEVDIECLQRSILLSPINPAHGLTVENLQARLRLILTYLLADHQNEHGLDGFYFELMVNPNQSEGRNAYTTLCGDLHTGRLSLNSHKEKAHQLRHMVLMRDEGLYGFPPVEAFHYVLADNKPTAELQGRSYGVKDDLSEAEVKQYDEDSLGRTYEEMEIIGHLMLHTLSRIVPGQYITPIEVFDLCQQHYFPMMPVSILHDKIVMAYKYWPSAQHKLVCAPVGMTWGSENIEHKLSNQTPCLNAFHSGELALLTLYCIDKMAAARGTSFIALTQGLSLACVLSRAIVDLDFARELDAQLWGSTNIDLLGSSNERKIEELYRCLLAQKPQVMQLFNRLMMDSNPIGRLNKLAGGSPEPLVCAGRFAGGLFQGREIDSSPGGKEICLSVRTI